MHVLFQCLYPEMADLRKEKRWFGLDRWLQYTSAEVLYRHGVDLEKEALGTPRTRTAKGLHPVGMPKRPRLETAGATPLPPRAPQTHTLVNVSTDKKALPKSGSYVNNRPTEWWTNGGYCCACQKLAEGKLGSE